MKKWLYSLVFCLIFTQKINAKPMPTSNSKAPAMGQKTQVNTQTAENEAPSMEEILTYLPTDERYYKIFKTFTNSPKNLDTIMRALIIYEKNKMTSGGAIGATNIKNADDSRAEEDGDESGYFEASNDKYAGNVYLKSILFLSKNNWTIWVNDEKISAEMNKNGDSEFFVEKITKDRVELVRRLSRGQWKHMNSENQVDAGKYRINNSANKVELMLTLHPNQTYVMGRDEIIDGKYKEEVLYIDEFGQSDSEAAGDESGMMGDDTSFDDLLTNP
jgi:hypothetical protein